MWISSAQLRGRLDALTVKKAQKPPDAALEASDSKQPLILKFSGHDVP